MAQVKDILRDKTDEFWIGLYGDVNNWKWSLEKDGFYEKGQADLRLWNSGEPNNADDHFLCGDIQPGAAWSDYRCTFQKPFVCYNGKRTITALYNNENVVFNSYCKLGLK